MAGVIVTDFMDGLCVDMTQEMAQKTRRLKAVVTILGVLIVLCFGIIIFTIAVRLSGIGEPDTDSAPVETVSRGAEGGKPAAEIAIPLSPGAVLEDYRVTAGRIVFRIKLADGGRRILVHDLETGAQLGSFLFAPPEPEESFP